jgi:adenine-specific DNA-methyltransferase
MDVVKAAVAAKPYYESANALIYNADSLELLPLLPSSISTLAITSPPYNIGKAYETNLPVQEYIDWCGKWLRMLPRVIHPTGAFWLNLGYLEHPDHGRVPIAYLLWQLVPFSLVQELVWHYGAGVAAKHYFSPRNEKFLWYVRDKQTYTFHLDEVRDPDVKYPTQKKNGKLRCNPLGKNPTDVWQIPKVTSGRACAERTAHPAQFPCALIDRIIRACSNAGEIILDPFLGSGSTAESALRAGRKVIGIEKNAAYCAIAAARIADVEKELLEANAPAKKMRLQQTYS